MSLQFEDLGLLPQFMQAIEQLGFEQPTPIQEAAIPLLLEGRNVIGQAQTGTGKTAAYALPMLQQIKPGKGVQALVLTPTRELAIQVTEATSRMSNNSPVRVLAVYGGQSYTIQTRQLQKGVEVVVGTPGRLMDLMRQNYLDLSKVKYLVLDEADEMLEMGFVDDVETILAQIPDERQIALFSATLPQAVRKLAEKYMSDPRQIAIASKQLTVAETDQKYCRVREGNKLAALSRFLEIGEVKSALIFARTKIRAQELSDELNQIGYPCESLHGDLSQQRREMVLNRFRQHSVTLLVATDVAARGLDIDDVSHVINYDMPNDAEDYVHRIGRTGRAGKKGISITFITPRERRNLNLIEAYTRQIVTEIRVPSDQEILERRNDRFMARLTEQLGKGNISQERALIARLEETSFDLIEIAAAAMQLARSSEGNAPLIEFSEPPVEQRRSSSKSYDRRPEMVEFTSDRRKGSKPGGRERVQDRSGAPKPFGRGRGSEQGMVRLMMNLGNENGLRPSDVVGAIASEVGIPGKAIGEIDIQQNHTFVDVAEMHVEKVLRESGGKYFMRGKPVVLRLAN
jgi:ATP-dependent RNA helicase DeaD